VEQKANFIIYNLEDFLSIFETKEIHFFARYQISFFRPFPSKRNWQELIAGTWRTSLE
jgi:hypothetical protein